VQGTVCADDCQHQLDKVFQRKQAAQATVCTASESYAFCHPNQTGAVRKPYLSLCSRLCCLNPDVDCERCHLSLSGADHRPGHAVIVVWLHSLAYINIIIRILATQGSYFGNLGLKSWQSGAPISAAALISWQFGAHISAAGLMSWQLGAYISAAGIFCWQLGTHIWVIW
jgi:hypothetical protein